MCMLRTAVSLQPHSLKLSTPALASQVPPAKDAVISTPCVCPKTPRKSFALFVWRSTACTYPPSPSDRHTSQYTQAPPTSSSQAPHPPYPAFALSRESRTSTNSQKMNHGLCRRSVKSTSSLRVTTLIRDLQLSPRGIYSTYMTPPQNVPTNPCSPSANTSGNT